MGALAVFSPCISPTMMTVAFWRYTCLSVFTVAVKGDRAFTVTSFEVLLV